MKKSLFTHKLLSPLLAVGVSACLVASMALAQNPDEFLNEDDFENPPPGAFVPDPNAPPPPPASPNFGNMQPPPPVGGGADEGGPMAGGGTTPAGGTPFGAKNSKGAKRHQKFEELAGDLDGNVKSEEKVNFDYPNAEITDIIKAISTLTGKNFIIDPNVRGKISIISPSPISVAEAYKAFLSSLAINGFTVVPSGKFLKIKSARNAQRDSINTYSGSYSPNTDQMITRIIHLKHISAEEVNKSLRILPSKDGEMAVYTPTNSVILADYGSNIERVMNILAQLDVPGFEEQMEVITIRNAKAKDIADLVDQIINKGESKKNRGNAFTAGIPRFGTNNQKSSSAFSMVIPDDRTNSIIVLGNKAGLEKIKKLVARLDFRIRPEDAGGVYVYYVRYGSAEKLAETLNGIAKEAKGKKDDKNSPNLPPPIPGMETHAPSGSEGVFGGDVKIGFDKATNSLIVTASKQDYEVVKSLLRKIDIPRNQVYVETVIMEMGTEDKNAWQPTYYKFIPETGGVGRAGFSSGNLGSLLSPANDSGAILGFGSGDTFQFNAGGVQTTVKSLMGFITFLKSMTDVNILSTPQITALDNEEAEIEVGDNVPVAASTSQGTTATTTSVTREPVTLKLKITPNISPGTNSVRMKIDQVIKQISDRQVAAENLAKNAISTSERTIKTNIVVKNGDTAVLGGLIRDRQVKNVSKVPILGDIPILGWLFKSTSTRTEKVNLLMFVTPKIIRTDSDRSEILSQKLNERLDFVKDNWGGRDPNGKLHEKLQRKADANRSKEGVVK